MLKFWLKHLIYVGIIKRRSSNEGSYDDERSEYRSDWRNNIFYTMVKTSNLECPKLEMWWCSIFVKGDQHSE